MVGCKRVGQDKVSGKKSNLKQQLYILAETLHNNQQLRSQSDRFRPLREPERRFPFMHVSSNTPTSRVTADEALEILRRFGASNALVAHCEAVRDLAVQLCEVVSLPVDRDLVEAGALLHDLGRVRTQGLLHVAEGVWLAGQLGLPEKIRCIIQRHVGAGLSSAEAQEAGLPPGHYLPETPEEKIVAYADNLVYGHRVMTFEESVQRFSTTLGRESPVVRRMFDLHHEIRAWCDGKS